MTHEYWYLSRAAGFTAYLLLFASSALGIAMSTKLAARLKRGNVTFDVHRFLALLALAFSVFHVYVLLGDQWFNFSVWQLSAPFLLPYRTVWSGVGSVSLYALAVISASFWLKRYIGYRTWRRLHYATFVMYASATAHGLLAGTDTAAPWARLLYATTGLGLLLMVLYRVAESPATNARARRARIVMMGATAVASMILAFVTGAMVTAGVPGLAG